MQLRSLNPIDWFEVTLTITLNLSLYIKVGINAGFFQITLFEIRFDFNLVILGPLKYTPQPFDPVARVDENTGTLAVLLDDGMDVICESKEGTVSDERIQCWENDPGKKNPVIMTFLNVKSLNVPGDMSNRRVRRGLASKGSLDLNCVMSDNDVS